MDDNACKHRRDKNQACYMNPQQNPIQTGRLSWSSQRPRLLLRAHERMNVQRMHYVLRAGPQMIRQLH